MQLDHSAPPLAASLDPAAIAHAVQIMWPDLGDLVVVELRALDVPGYAGSRATWSGYFGAAEPLAREAVRLSEQGGNVYVTLNPVLPDLLARANNRCVRRSRHATSDDEIGTRRWLLVDLDPVRPAGISSTDAELAAAEARGRAIRDHLASLGWPDPVVVASGNGVHLRYRVALPARDGHTVQGVLRSLSEGFSDGAVDVDTTVHNAARIARLPGTVARKGDPTPTRPHRLARITHVPETLQTVSPEALAAATPPEPRSVPSSTPVDRAAPRPSTDDPRAEVRRRMPITTFLAEEGLEPTSGRHYYCPIHGEAENPRSFHVYDGRDGLERWRCFGDCDRGGDLYDLAQALWGVGFREALERLATRVGVDLAGAGSAEAGPVADADHDPSVVVVADQVEDLLAHVERYRGRRYVGLPTGTLPELDAATLGLRDLILLAAPPEAGKTTLAVQLGVDVVAENPDACLVVASLEMPRMSVLTRMVCALARVDWRTYVLGEIHGREALYSRETLERIEAAHARLADLGRRIAVLDVDDVGADLVRSAGRRADALRATSGASRAMTVVDYCQVMEVPEGVHDLAADQWRIDALRRLRDRLDGDPVLAISEARKPSGRGGAWGTTMADVMGSARLAYTPDLVALLRLAGDEHVLRRLGRAVPGTSADLREQAAEARMDLRTRGCALVGLEIAKGRDGVTRRTIELTHYYRQSRLVPGTPDELQPARAVGREEVVAV